MNPTTLFLIAVLALLLTWEATAIPYGYPTITATVRSWGPGWALALIVATAVLVWHLWIQPPVK